MAGHRKLVAGALAVVLLIASITAPHAQAASGRSLRGILQGGSLTTSLPIAIPSVRLSARQTWRSSYSFRIMKPSRPGHRLM